MNAQMLNARLDRAFELWDFEAVDGFFEEQKGFAREAFSFYCESAQLERALAVLQRHPQKFEAAQGQDLEDFLGGKNSRLSAHIQASYEFMSRLRENSLGSKEACEALHHFLPQSSPRAKSFFIKAAVDYFLLNDPDFFSYASWPVLVSLHNDFDGTLMGRLYMDKFEHAFKNNVFKGGHLRHKKRIALAISGALRGKNWLKLLNKIITDLGLEADVFFFTWDREYHWMGLGGSSWWVHRLFANEPELIASVPDSLKSHGAFHQNFPQTHAKLHQATSTRLSLIKVRQIKNLVAFSVENEEEFVEKFKLQPPANCQKMWYGKFRLLQMIEEHEAREGFKYDFIINLRPDGILEGPCDFARLEALEPMEVSVILGGEGVNDACLAGRSPVMKLFLGIWETALNNKHLGLFATAPQGMGTHYLPHRLFMLEGVRIRKPFLALNITNLGLENWILPHFEPQLERDLQSTPLKGEELEKALKFFERFKDAFAESSEKALLGAPARVSNHLAYKLGLAMIRNSKSFWGYVKLPYILMSIKIAHQEEQKIIQEKIKYGHKSEPLPLELYDDYEEAMRIREFLSYKMGEALMRGYKNL
ncbi:MAG: hypothetical protein Q4A73_06045, partial [Campylobacter sp.]|nr:hypothetical protein [Campylobacter sp.]